MRQIGSKRGVISTLMASRTGAGIEAGGRNV